MNIDTPKPKSKPRSRAAGKRKAAAPSDPPQVTNPGIVAGATIGLATSSLKDGWIAVPIKGDGAGVMDLVGLIVGVTKPTSATPDAPQAPASPAPADDGYLSSDVAFVVSWYLAHPEYIQRAVDEALNPPTTEPDDQSVAAPILDLVPHVLSAAMWRDAAIQAPGVTASAPIRVMMPKWEAIPSDVFGRTEIFSLKREDEAERPSTEELRAHTSARMLERQGIARAFAPRPVVLEAAVIPAPMLAAQPRRGMQPLPRGVHPLSPPVRKVA